MSKQELINFLFGVADRANEMLAADRRFNYDLGITFSSFANHALSACDCVSFLNELD